MRTIKEKLNAAFKDLRKQGFLARQNYLCCQNCGSTALYAEAETILKETGGVRDIKGIVFYHGQDNDDLREHRNFHIAYGDGSLTTLEVGQHIVKTFTNHEIRTQWNGEESKRIEVIVEGELK